MRKDKGILRSKPWINKEFLELNWIDTQCSLSEIACKIGVSESWLSNRAIRLGVHKGTKFKYCVNTSKLYNITDPMVSYLAGLIVTDGYIPKRVTKIEIGLTGQDEYNLLLSLNNYFENTYPIYNYKENEYRLVISDKNIKLFFNNAFNIPDGPKTYTIGTPNNFYNEDCAKMYLRGCIDGDGSIGIDRGNPKYNTIRFVTGSENLVTGLIQIIAQYTKIQLNLYYQNKVYNNVTKHYPGFEVKGWRANLILDWMYSYKPTFGLARKYNKYHANNNFHEDPTR